MPASQLALVFAVVLAGVEGVLYLLYLGAGRLLDSSDMVHSAKSSLATLCVLSALALIFASGAFDLFLQVFGISGVQQQALSAMQGIYDRVVEWIGKYIAVNAVVSAVVESGKILIVTAVLDPIDRFLDALAPLLIYALVFMQFVHAFLEFSLKGFPLLSTCGAVLIVPKFTRAVGAGLLSFALTFYIIFPGSLALLYHVHSHDYAQDISQLESIERQANSQSSSLLTGSAQGSVVWSLKANLLGIFGRIPDMIASALKHIILDTILLPVVSFLLSMMNMAFLYRMLSMENLQDRISTALFTMTFFRRFG